MTSTQELLLQGPPLKGQHSVFGTHILERDGHMPSGEAFFLQAVFRLPCVSCITTRHETYTVFSPYVRVEFPFYLGLGYSQGLARAYYRQGLLFGVEVTRRRQRFDPPDFLWGHCARTWHPTSNPDIPFVARGRGAKPTEGLGRLMMAAKGMTSQCSAHEIMHAGTLVQNRLRLLFGDSYQLA
jgi:hypothetical protein